MDQDYQEIIKQRLRGLSPELKSFVLDDSWRGEVSGVAKQNNFSEENSTIFENEIFFVLIGLEPKEDLPENLVRELEIDIDTSNSIVQEVENAVFSKVQSEIDAMWNEEKTQEVPVAEEEIKPRPSIKIEPQSFEQIILNQARAMQPARPASENVAGGPARPAGSTPAPTNLPGAEGSEPEKPRVVHNYTREADPYREPIS